MKILHITDFHFSDKNVSEQVMLVDKLANKLEQIEKIDFVFFTGDLVLKGGEKGTLFKEASNLLLERIRTVSKVDFNNVFICAGNHDVVRNQEIPAIKTHIDGLLNNQMLDDFVTDKDPRQYMSSLDNIAAYNQFQNEFYKNYPTEDTIRDLFTIHKRTFQDKVLGIVSINTAWRCVDSTKDRGNLLYPIKFINEAIMSIKECDIKILLMHHPISDFREYINFEIENIIYNNFDFLFSGHVHKQKMSTHITGDEGIFACTSPATLTVYDNNSNIGFSIIEINNINFHKAEVFSYIYDRSSQMFFQPNSFTVEIPLGSEKD